jgi:hypothetical protein
LIGTRSHRCTRTWRPAPGGCCGPRPPPRVICSSPAPLTCATRGRVSRSAFRCRTACGARRTKTRSGTRSSPPTSRCLVVPSVTAYPSSSTGGSRPACPRPPSASPTSRPRQHRVTGGGRSALPGLGAVGVDVHDRYALAPGTVIAGPALFEERETSCSVGQDAVVTIDSQYNLIIDIDAGSRVT